MYLTAREKQILYRLLSEKQELSVQFLADQLSVSKRTVQRDLKGLQTLLKEHHLDVNNDGSRGLLLEGSDDEKRRLLEKVNELEPFEYTADERQTIISCNLLEADGPVKLAALANELRVTPATISHDLDAVEETLKDYDLELIRKRGYGVEIKGKERNIRQFISGLLADQLDERESITALKDKVGSKDFSAMPGVSERLLGFIDLDKLEIVEKAVKDCEQSLQLALADRAMVGLIVHIALAVERIENGEEIEMKQELLEELKQTKEFGWAKRLAERLNQDFEAEIPLSEVGFITMHLRGAKVRNEETGDAFDEVSWPIMQACRQLIELMERSMNVKFRDKSSLLQGLVAHLKPALYRMENRMPIQNPLLAQIRTDYSELFVRLKEVMPKVFKGVEIPETEIGYLVMHFGAYLRKEARPVKMLVICSSGIGSSKLLSSRLEQTFPEIKRIENGSVQDLREKDLSRYDLILSTVPISDGSRRVVEVNPFLSEADIRRIRLALTEIQAGEPIDPIEEIKDKVGTNNNGMAVFLKIRHFTDAIQSVLKHFEVSEADGKDLKEIFHGILMNACDHGTVLNDHKLLGKLLSRQELSGMGIPGTHCALIHTKDEAVTRASFTVHPLKIPVVLDGMDGEPMECRTILFMLAPEESNAEIMQLLSHISTLVIENERSIALFTDGDQETVRNHLEQKLMSFFEEQLQQLGVREP